MTGDSEPNGLFVSPEPGDSIAIVSDFIAPIEIGIWLRMNNLGAILTGYKLPNMFLSH